MSFPKSISLFAVVCSAAFLLLFFVWQPLARKALSQEKSAASGETDDPEAAVKQSFDQQVQPLLNQYCRRCHHADKRESGIRVDHLNGKLEDRHIKLWENIKLQLEEENMPPFGEAEPSAAERKRIIEWIDEALVVAKSRPTEKNGSVRRLTVSQYRNTLRDLLGLQDDLTDILPPDAVSKDGFLNNQETMLLNPLLLESYFQITEKALDRTIVDEHSKPQIQNFRMDLGDGINPEPCPDELILGALSHLLENDDFIVTQLTPEKPFDYEPFFMKTHYRFIEGYQGNATVRGWREFDSIYHAVFACMRGKGGYPKGNAYETIPEGLLLRPAIPSLEQFKVDSTYGPQANFKISLRELPDEGLFRVKVAAARYNDGLLLDNHHQSQEEGVEGSITVTDVTNPQTVEIPQAGIYQVDVFEKLTDEETKPQDLSLQLGDRYFSNRLTHPAFVAVRIPQGPLNVSAQIGGGIELDRIVLTQLNPSHEPAQEFERFERRAPRVGVHVGLRRDCGSTLNPVGQPQTVSSTDLQEYVFEGAISNFPSPEVEKDNVNYLAGIREIGVRSEYTDGRDMPRLLIRSVEFEGPYYEKWPPRTHRNIFLESKHQDDPDQYAREIVRSFASRAYRRPLTADEFSLLMNVWSNSFAENDDFRKSIKDTLLVVLTSPQFLFLIEKSDTPKPEPLTEWELASKLSYFLWNTAPDKRLKELAATGKLHESLDAETDRLIDEPRFEQFLHEFASQWLSLDKFDVVEIDRQRYPNLTPAVREHLRNEPAEFLKYLIRNNLPVRNLIQSDFIVANEVVASYYELGDRTESGFEYRPIPHDNDHLGGLLTQAAILSGLSDGRESNPVKRGAWLARKIISEPPDDPPPNVPELDADNKELTLREKLEVHRNQKGCLKCHSGIDPWGVPFEELDAGGLFKTNVEIDASSTLPDGTDVDNFNELRDYLAHDRIDRVAFSFLKHLAIYSTGRTLSYNETEWLKEECLRFRRKNYPIREMIHFLVKSPLFLEK
jgi:hypothetical protein